MSEIPRATYPFLQIFFAEKVHSYLIRYPVSLQFVPYFLLFFVQILGKGQCFNVLANNFANMYGYMRIILTNVLKQFLRFMKKIFAETKFSPFHPYADAVLWSRKYFFRLRGAKITNCGSGSSPGSG